MRLLDTDLLISALRGQPRAVDYVKKHRADVGTTTINAAELYEGAAASQRPEEGRERVEGLLATLSVVPFGPRHARAFGPLARTRKQKGLAGGAHDLLIASIAVGEAAILVTRNVRDFEGHDGLTVEPW